MAKSKHAELGLLQLDREDDPRGGVISWALFAVIAALIAAAILTMI